jgi:hypothetical protein
MTEKSHKLPAAVDPSVEQQSPIGNSAPHARSKPLGRRRDSSMGPADPYPDPDEYADPDAPLREGTRTTQSAKASAEPAAEEIAPPAPSDGEIDDLHLLPRGDPEC